MGIDILVLRVLCLLCGGATEIPRINAPTHPDLLRGFAVNQTQSPGPNRTSSGPGWDAVWTGFFITFLPRPRHNPSPLNPFRKTPSRALFFGALIPPHPRLPLHQMHRSATLSKVVSEPNRRSSLH